MLRQITWPHINWLHFWDGLGYSSLGPGIGSMQLSHSPPPPPPKAFQENAMNIGHENFMLVAS